ncbi:MAG: heavy-metal-associated domain-containing protein [Gammaproteobacteria bacterium]|nr:heavy-metal-associated domain-containing protein [Gammaproteobacteria bacterium]
MKKLILLTVINLLWSTTLFAAGTQYNLRVDGLSCPFCAYGIEKKLIKTEGVASVTFDLEKGLIKVKVGEGVILTEAQLKRLVDDAGFTLRSMSKQFL